MPATARAFTKRNRPGMRRADVSAKAVSKGKAIWAGEVFCLSGTFKASHEDIRRWVNYHGGRVVDKVTDDTTYLICSMEDFEKKVTAVKEARKLGKQCGIISYAYIEDCLLTPKKPKRLSEGPYLLSKELSKKRKSVHDPTKNNDGFIKDIEETKLLVDPKLWRTYMDSTCFTYEILLTRDSENYKGIKYQDRYMIYLFESRAKPHLYLLGDKYQKGKTAWRLLRDEGSHKPFEVAFQLFKKRFLEKTGIHWDQRLDKVPAVEGKYVYSPPTGGKPVGLLSEGWSSPTAPEPELPEDDQGFAGADVSATTHHQKKDNDGSNDEGIGLTDSIPADVELEYEDAVAGANPSDAVDDDVLCYAHGTARNVERNTFLE